MSTIPPWAASLPLSERVIRLACDADIRGYYSTARNFTLAEAIKIGDKK